VCASSAVDGVRCGFCLPCSQTTPGVVTRTAARSPTAAAPGPHRPSLRPSPPDDDPLHHSHQLEQEQQVTPKRRTPKEVRCSPLARGLQTDSRAAKPGRILRLLSIPDPGVRG
jgi:hypothetical protein